MPFIGREILDFQPFSQHKTGLSVYSAAFGNVAWTSDDFSPETLLAGMDAAAAQIIVKLQDVCFAYMRPICYHVLSFLCTFMNQDLI